VQIRTDNAPTHVSSKMKQFFAYYNIKHIVSITQDSTGQAVVERSNRTLKEMRIKQKRKDKDPQGYTQ
jgi:transposase InsO family protein